MLTLPAAKESGPAEHPLTDLSNRHCRPKEPHGSHAIGGSKAGAARKLTAVHQRAPTQRLGLTSAEPESVVPLDSTATYR